MSVGTSDTTVISPLKTEARNLNAIDASAAPRDDGSPATIPTTTPKNRHILLKMKKDIKYAAAVESEAQTLETYKAASAAHDVHNLWDLFR